MFRWYKELSEIRFESQERRAKLYKEQHLCESCETLKHQLETSNYEKKLLMDRLLERPSVEVPSQPVTITKPMNVPWNVRRQMLETEDRERARLIREAPKPVSTEDLEKELDLASATREETEG